MSATGHNLRRRVIGATRVMELLGDNPDLVQFNERFRLNASSKEQLFDLLQSRNDVGGIAVQLELEPVRQLAPVKPAKEAPKEKATKTTPAKPPKPPKEKAVKPAKEPKASKAK